MFRGTTPTIRINLEVDASTLDELFLTIVQNKRLILEKALTDASLVDNTALFYLSQEDTLALSAQAKAQVQVTGLIGTHRFTSEVFTIIVDDVLKDGVI